MRIRTGPLVVPGCADIVLGLFGFERELRTSVEDDRDPDICLVSLGFKAL